MDKKKTLLIVSISLNIIFAIFIGIILFLKRDIIFEQSVENTDAQVGQSQEENSVEESEEISTEEENDETKEVVVEKTVDIYYFDTEKFNEPNNTNYLTAVQRKTGRVDVATYALEQIIEGPTFDEKEGLSLDDSFGSDAFVKFLSESDCSGKDFIISIDDGLATVDFCREVQFLNDNSDIVLTQIVETLKQFPTIDEVTVLTEAGECFSGMGGYTLEECVF